MVQRYVVGFVFGPGDGGHLVLQMKAKPPWQAGRLNGPGGKMEDGETPQVAVARELSEETTLNSHPDEWRLFAILKGKDWEVNFLMMRYEHLQKIETRNPEEPIFIYTVMDLWRPLALPNLRWLVPLALDQTVMVPVVIEDTVP